jgi:hypothetical protein
LSRSMGWGLRTARRPFAMWPGRTWAMQDFPIEFSGTRRSPPSIRTMTLAESGFTGFLREDRTRSAGCCFIPSSTRFVYHPAAVTTIEWTRSGGTSSGWVGRSGLSMLQRPMLITYRGCRASCCSFAPGAVLKSVQRCMLIGKHFAGDDGYHIYETT